MTTSWTPDACTLPTVERPLRAAAFEQLFTSGLRYQERVSSTALRWRFDPSTTSEARRLAELETECCSFFTFTFDGDDVTVAVPAEHTAVLDALQALASHARPAEAPPTPPAQASPPARQTPTS
jgi:hypothetical protein